MPNHYNNVISWASDIDDATIRQAERTGRLPVLAGPVALMPDAHVGLGATVGSVIPTTDAILPAAVGVDVGCGMIAAELDVNESDLPDDLGPMLSAIEAVVPAGVGKGHDAVSRAADRWLGSHAPVTQLDAKLAKTAAAQFGTLGSGNHFVEVCVDERGRVWVVLHSGSRGVGNRLAQMHIVGAKRLAKQLEMRLEDPDLAYLMEGSVEFNAYIGDMLWSQEYAAANRDTMMSNVMRVVLAAIGKGSEVDRLNCHHNFSARENHGGVDMWITRKGAIRAGVGDRGVIPGSMGTRSYIVTGLGNTESWRSCSHGAGRRMSRSEAKRRFTVEDLAAEMGDKTWLAARAEALIDEIPSSYKDIDVVMADQADLVTVDHELRQVLNYKGC